ncbi:MAG TPA: helix-turn-helix domain-containing protein [Kineosporiaceae bacterium]|nr:helix-turn-helix domain-containing protein [Kineosporiaceae bacterium]
MPDRAEGPRRRLSPQARREQLLDVTLELAARGDVALVSAKDVAERAGVSEALVFHYFGTRQELVAAAVSRAAQALLAGLEAGPVAASPRGQVEAALDAYLAHVREQPTGWRALLAARTGELAEVAADVERRSQAWALWVLGVPEPGPALRIALAGWGGFEREACLTWLDHPDVPASEVKAQLLATLTAALAAAAAHDPQARRALEHLTGDDAAG